MDRLFASPHYGERMALPWLDAARYADSNGFQQDGDTYQYVWRDWVVTAMNANMPFDQFTIQQLAGDLLPERHARPEDRDRLQPLPPAQRRRRRDPGRAAQRHPVRPRRCDGHHLARRDDGLRAVPRPQVRSRHAARLLLLHGLLQQRAGERHALRAAASTASPIPGSRRRPTRTRRSSRTFEAQIAAAKARGGYASMTPEIQTAQTAWEADGAPERGRRARRWTVAGDRARSRPTASMPPTTPPSRRRRRST